MVREVYMDRREDETISGMRAVEGYYKSKDGPVRQINVYDVRTDEEAIERARADGLLRPLMLEVFLGEPQPCRLLNKREKTEVN